VIDPRLIRRISIAPPPRSSACRRRRNLPNRLDRAKELRAKNTISASEFRPKGCYLPGRSAATASAVAAKNAAALNLEFTQVKSPIDGRVSDERITLGNLVQPGAGPENVLPRWSRSIRFMQRSMRTKTRS